MDVFDYQLLYTSVFTDSQQRDLNTPDPSTGLMGTFAPLSCRRPAVVILPLSLLC